MSYSIGMASFSALYTFATDLSSSPSHIAPEPLQNITLNTNPIVQVAVLFPTTLDYAERACYVCRNLNLSVYHP